MKNKTILLAIISMLLLITTAVATPNDINIQGKLTNSGGTIQTGTFSFTFTIYDNATSGTQLYQTNISATTDSRGIYDVVLKNINLPFDKQYYLGITVGSDSEMAPRINLTTVPYSAASNRTKNLNTSQTAIANQLDATSAITVGGGYSQGGITLESDGDIITEGDIIFSGNITILNVTDLNVNGSTNPTLDATFDLGNSSNRWRNANFSGIIEAMTLVADNIISPGLNNWNTSGTFLHMVNPSYSVGIGTATPDAKLDIETTEDTEFIRLTDSTNGDTVGIYTGTGDPSGQVSAQQGSLYMDHGSGTLYRKDSDIGSSNWVEVGSENSGVGNNTPHFAKMTRNAVKSLSNSNYTLVQFDTVNFSTGIITDTNNGTFNITKSGTYLITAGMLTEAVMDDGESLWLYITVNGERVNQKTDLSSAASQTLGFEISEVFSLTQGDQINLEVWHNEGAAINTRTEVLNRPYMSVVQIDPDLTAAGGWIDGNGSVTLDNVNDNVTAGTLFIDNENNRVGIGTTAPSSQLHLDTSGYASITLGNNTGDSFYITKETSDNSFSLWNGTFGSGTRRFAVQNDGDTWLAPNGGYVGIGTTTANKSLVVIGDVNISQNLNVSGTIQASYYVGDGSLLEGLTEFTNQNLSNYLGEPNASIVRIGNISTLFSERNNSLLNQSGTNTFLKNNAGNLGIGTLTPGARLEISDAEDTALLRLSDATNADEVSFYIGIGTPEGTISAQRGSLYIDHSGGSLYIKTLDAGASGWEIVSSNATAAGNFSKWNETGDTIYPNNITSKVGIGTATPSVQLEVEGSGIPLYLDSTTDNGLKIGWLDSGTITGYIGGSSVLDNSFYVSDSFASTQFVVKNSTGYVGIGTSDPQSQLQVNATQNAIGITTNGTVGIGTTAPSDTLTVIGNASITGNTTLGTSSTPTNLTMYSPDGSAWRCGPNNSGSWECSN